MQALMRSKSCLRSVRARMQLQPLQHLRGVHTCCMTDTLPYGLHMREQQFEVRLTPM
jgi:hypothetical protein